VSDDDWFRDKGLTPATRCKQCREYRLVRPGLRVAAARLTPLAPQLSRTLGHDPEALFPLADSALRYRELRNEYVVAHEAQAAALKAEKVALKAARVLLAGGKVGYRRAARRATTKARRVARKAAAAEAAVAAGEAPPARAPLERSTGRPVGPATALQRLGRED